ncbi:oligosaccharide flippase family protein [Gammaproteobacteria bacterium]|nr:oligosaccharide flippase family protein [Gammaproteobacteria bacterium]MDB9859532.1 oligosaccharide flippase family protein [Gammaproteobacteria bacterium]
MNPLKALGYSASEKILRAIINIAFIAFIGRLLLPSELGVFAILWAIYQLLQSFFGSTLVNAYLRSNKSLDTTQILFGASIFVGTIGFLLFIALKPLVEITFSISFAWHNYFFIAIVLFLLPINSFLRGILQGRSDFDKIAIVELMTLSISVFVSVILLIKGYGIFALCLKYFAESVATIIAYALILKIRPEIKFTFFSHEILPLLQYAMGLSTARLSGAMTANLTSLFIGYLFALQYVAYFSYSITLAKIPDNLFRTMVTSPALTYLGKYKGDLLYEKCQLIASAILFFAMLPAILIVVAGDDLLLILMGPQWKEFAPLFQIMGFFAISQVLKGWLTILYINFMDMTAWNKITFLELILIFALMAISFFFQFSIISFVQWFSFVELGLWIIIYIFSNIRFSPQRPNLIQRFVDLKLLLIPAVIIIFLMQINISFDVTFLNITIYLILILCMSLLLTYIFDRASINHLSRLCKDLFDN